MSKGQSTSLEIKERWYNAESGREHESLIPQLQRIKQRQQFRHIDNLRFAKLYGNLDILGLNAVLYNQIASAQAAPARVTLNVVQSCVDTAAAKISKNKPLPKFLTDGANWGLQQRAKNLNKFIAGSFYQADTYQSSDRCFVHGAVFGTGVKKIFPQGKRICSEWTLPDEIIVDDMEAWYGKPKNLYQQKAVSREDLKADHPEYGKLIDELPRIDGVAEYVLADAETNDLVLVYEAWHLPTRNDKGELQKDGRHAIVIPGATLESDAWTRDSFPFAFFQFVPKLLGIWGQGIPEMNMGIQLEINKLLKEIQIAHHLCSSPAVFVEKDSGVMKSQMTNGIGRVIEYHLNKPEIQVFAAVHPEKYQHLIWLVEKAFEQPGISQLSAQSRKPAGLDSGRALREFNDIESERFVKVGQRWEQFHLDEAEQHLLCAKDIAKQYPDYAVPSKNKNSIEFIRWKDVEIERDAFMMQVFPVSALPRDPAERMQTVQEWSTAGWIDPDTAIELMDFPDIEKYQSIKLAKRDLVKDYVNQILEKGEYDGPEPYMDLGFCVDYAQLTYNWAKLRGCPEPRLELLRRFIEQAKSMLPPPPAAPNPVGPPAIPPAAAGQPMPGAPMMGAPGAASPA